MKLCRVLSAIFTAVFIVPQASAKEGDDIEQRISAWHVSGPLADRVEADVDTLYLDYAQKSVPTMRSIAYACTGNLGAQGETLIYFERKPASDFFFRDAIATWLPSTDKYKFYNTRIPMTLLSYNFGGGKETGQDRLQADFSGNINRKAAIGVMLDYLYSKGSYNYQADKDLTWGFSGSYIGDRYEVQGFYYHYNFLNKENGGIEDDRYITDPAEVQGGSTSVDYKTIPTRLTAAHTRVVGGQLFLNQKYNFGFWKEVEKKDVKKKDIEKKDIEKKDVEKEDTIVKEYVPVTQLVWTLEYNAGRHTFRNSNATQNVEFWPNTYFNLSATEDLTEYWSIGNTFGVALLEGFNKYAAAGLTVYLRQKYNHFTLPLLPEDAAAGSPSDDDSASALTPLPAVLPPSKESENMIWAGAQLARRQGRILNYEATAEIGFVGEAAGEMSLRGDVYTRIPLGSDSLQIDAYGHFSNLAVPYLLKHYRSNHFVWDNDFGKTRRVRFGGSVYYPRTATCLSAGVENVQNLVYFNSSALPEQSGSSVQVFSATLRQPLRLGMLHWDNEVTYQVSSNQDVIPLPQLALYSNLYIVFRLAGALQVQFGVDCDYYTRYRSVGYQPATATFYNQTAALCGNYPFMNVYLNMKLSKTRFYIMFSHVNQGLIGGDNWFAMPHYPMNPRRFQLGLSIDFAN